MTDLVGADLQAEGSSGVIEATPAGTPTADAGTFKDATGNVYDDARQAASQASALGGTSSQPDASSTAQGGQNLGGQPQPQQPAVDPTILQAVQTAQARAAQAEARAAAYEQAQWEAQVRALPREQQQIAIAQRQMQLQQAQAQQAARAQALQQQALEPLFKEIVVTKLTQQYAHAGVNAQMLNAFNDPNAMEEFCRQWAANRRVTANAQRQAAGVDRAASAGSASQSAPSNWKGQSLREQLSAAFE
jgi:hypothetical protein